MIKISTLNNGIRVVTDSLKAGIVRLTVGIACGSRCETEKNNGISHTLEHMIFKGTKKRTEFDIFSSVEHIGGDLNGKTDADMTTYYMDVLKDDWASGLNILADIIQNATIESQALEKGKEVIIEEILQKNSECLTLQSFFQTAYPNQPEGLPVLGNEANIRSFTAQQLLDYMHTQYTPDRTVISATGDVDHQKFLDLCEKLFARIKPKKAPAVVPAKYVGGQLIIPRSYQQIFIMLGFKGVNMLDANYNTIQILSGILAEGRCSRLFRKIREEKGLVYRITSSAEATVNTGEFIINTRINPYKIRDLMPILRDEIASFADTLATDEEMTRAKTQLLRKHQTERWDILKRSVSNAKELLFRHHIQSDKAVEAGILSVTAKQVQTLAQQIFSSPLTFVASGPIHNMTDIVNPFDRVDIQNFFKYN